MEVNTIKYKQLDNGLRIVAEEIPYVRSVSLGVWINIGSRMENNENSGVAHFIEHMLFKGTEQRTSKKISNDIDYYGGNINAFTTHDHTCYHVKMPSNHIDRGIDVLSDIIINSKFDESEIEKEKLVISEEIKMYQDSPEDYVYDELLMRTFKNKGIGRNILGTMETVEAMNRKTIVDFFENYYVANNSVIVISGNFVFEDIVKKIEDGFKSWKSKELTPVREGQSFHMTKFLKDKDDEQANIAIIYECPDDKIDKDFYSIKLLGNILGNSPSSRLFQHIREERGLSYSIYTSDTFYVDYAEFGIFSSVASENLLEVYTLILKEIEDLKGNYISEEELTFAKEQYKGSVIMNLEDTEDRMMLIGEYEVVNKRLKEIDEVIKIVESIDMDYMKSIIDKIFKSDMSIGITGKSVKSIMKKIMK